ncbi:VOC family protein [Haladaptatus sp. DJG-WS-42]|uniref:VOC family protein n=1 Tax=Haladaptatus sp. DJG-WS-42 TaxID=3120516 RepID=UPI0030CF2FC1
MSKTQASHISALTHVSLVVEDQQAALDFYTEKLGFEKQMDMPMEEGSDDRWITIGVPGQDVEIALQAVGWFDGRDEEKLRPLVGNNAMLAFAVDDCHAAYEALKDRGVEFVSEPNEQDYGTEAIASDMEGNELLFLQPSADGSM